MTTTTASSSSKSVCLPACPPGAQPMAARSSGPGRGARAERNLLDASFCLSAPPQRHPSPGPAGIINNLRVMCHQRVFSHLPLHACARRDYQDSGDDKFLLQRKGGARASGWLLSFARTSPPQLSLASQATLPYTPESLPDSRAPPRPALQLPARLSIPGHRLPGPIPYPSPR